MASTFAALASALPIAIGVFSLRYALPGRPAAAPIPNATINPVALTLHAVPAALALIIAPLQLTPGLRTRLPGLHRGLGRAYAVLIPIASLAAIWIAPNAQGGLVSAAGFTALALAWMTTTAIGVDDPKLEALRRFVVRHVHRHRAATRAELEATEQGVSPQVLQRLQRQIAQRPRRVPAGMVGAVAIAAVLAIAVMLLVDYFGELLPAMVVGLTLSLPIVTTVCRLVEPRYRPRMIVPV